MYEVAGQHEPIHTIGWTQAAHWRNVEHPPRVVYRSILVCLWIDLDSITHAQHTNRTGHDCFVWLTSRKSRVITPKSIEVGRWMRACRRTERRLANADQAWAFTKTFLHFHSFRFHFRAEPEHLYIFRSLTRVDQDEVRSDEV